MVSPCKADGYEQLLQWSCPARWRHGVGSCWAGPRAWADSQCWPSRQTRWRPARSDGTTAEPGHVRHHNGEEVLFAGTRRLRWVRALAPPDSTDVPRRARAFGNVVA
jgi:hypothetical protein